MLASGCCCCGTIECVAEIIIPKRSIFSICGYFNYEDPVVRNPGGPRSLFMEEPLQNKPPSSVLKDRELVDICGQFLEVDGG